MTALPTPNEPSQPPATEPPATAGPARIDGALTVCTAKALRPRLLEGVTTTAGMFLDLSNVGVCDCATRKSALTAGRGPQFTALSPAILSAARSGGVKIEVHGPGCTIPHERELERF